MPMITDLLEVKSILEIDPANTVEDKKLLLFIEAAQAIIERCINRRNFFYESLTEFYSGYGTQVINLRRRPAYTTPTPEVWVNDNGFYGAQSGSFDSSEGESLTYGEDFCFQLYQEGQPSQSGILVRINRVWPRPTVRAAGLLSPYLGTSYGNIKITYTAGYTLNDLPADFRTAANLLLTNLRYIFPLGQPLASDSFEGRSISLSTERKDYLYGIVKPLLWHYRNWRM